MSEAEKINTIDFYEKSSIHGLKWTGLTEFLIRIVQFGVTIILARILNPIDFGIITLAFIFVKFVQLILDFGITSALIQNIKIAETEYYSYFTFLLILSFISAVVLFWNAEAIALLLDNTAITQILKYLIIIIPLNGLSIIPRVLLMQRLDFKHTSLADTFSAFGYSFAILISAILLQNLWCFVIGTIVEQIVLMLLLFYYSHWRPRLNFSLHEIKNIFNFSGSVFATRLVNFFNLNMLNILINRFFGSVALGIFSLAYQIIDMPTQRIAKNIMKVMFPVLSQLQERSAEYENMMFKFILIILVIILPFYTILFILAKPFIIIFYGEKWLAAIPILQLLCFAGLIRSLWTGMSAILMSSGRPQIELYLNLIMAVLLVPGIYLLKSLGMNIVIVYFTVILTLLYFYTNIKIMHGFKISFFAVIAKLRVPILATIILIIIISGIADRLISDSIQNLIPKFVLLSVMSVFVYLGSIYLLDRKMFLNFIKLAFNKI